MEKITIEGKTASFVTPEGKKVTMDVAQLIELITPRRMDTCGVGIPPGVRLIETRGSLTIWVYEQSPRVTRLKWIAENSPSPYGKGSKYRKVRIALPYLVTFAVFQNGMLGHANECFFRAAPVEDEDDELFYPGLLNCSRFKPPNGHPLSWICTQKLDPTPLLAVRNPKKRMRAGLRALMECLLEAGFNYSSEQHEFSSWFTESREVDKRISTIDRWQKETEKDPLFVLDVPWLKTDMSIRQLVERIFQNHKVQSRSITSSRDLARIMINSARK